MKRFRNPFRRQPRVVPGTTEEILTYIDTHGIDDKDRRAPIVPPPPRRSKVTRYVLDLHGMKSEEAEQRIDEAIEMCKDDHIREILIIHGRGIHSGAEDLPVLKTLVHNLLDGRLKNRVKRWRPGLPAEGGEGVTLLYLA